MTDIQFASLYGPKALDNTPVVVLTGTVGKTIVSSIEVINSKDHPVALTVWKNGHDQKNLLFGPTELRANGGRASWTGTMILNLSEELWMQAGEDKALTVSISGAIDS